MPRLATANDIINRAAVESGLPKSGDPVGSTDELFVQLTELLNGAGQELVELWPWEILVKPFQIVTLQYDTGTYDLPDDFAYMIDQTGWELTTGAPMGGPLSAQDWTYLKGMDLANQSIYASFRLIENKIKILPSPPPAGLDINFEYISRDWLAQQNATTNRHDLIQAGADLVLFDPIMTVKFLKAKFLEAKGFDSTGARIEFDTLFSGRTGRDTGAQVLSASSGSSSFPYLNPYYNVGSTNYGL